MSNDYTEVQTKIMEEARKLFVKKGLKGTTVRDIAAESGVNVAMVNYYFRSKEKLFDTIFDEAFHILAEKIFGLADSNLPFFELIRQWIYSYYDTLLEYPDFPIFVLNELVANPRKLSRKFKDKNPYHLYMKLSERIKEEEAKGTIHLVSIPDFLLNVISLSIFPFAVRPIAIQFLNLSEDNYMKLLDKHREYVADFVIKAIKT
jgi:AcrR family transcriptional regulator